MVAGRKLFFPPPPHLPLPENCRRRKKGNLLAPRFLPLCFFLASSSSPSSSSSSSFPLVSYEKWKMERKETIIHFPPCVSFPLAPFEMFGFPFVVFFSLEKWEDGFGLEIQKESTFANLSLVQQKKEKKSNLRNFMASLASVMIISLFSSPTHLIAAVYQPGGGGREMKGRGKNNHLSWYKLCEKGGSVGWRGKKRYLAITMAASAAKESETRKKIG